MKERVIIFPFDDVEGIKDKVDRIKHLIGEENVMTYGLGWHVPQINIRCGKKQWKEIQFICDLCKCYW